MAWVFPDDEDDPGEDDPDDTEPPPDSGAWDPDEPLPVLVLPAVPDR